MKGRKMIMEAITGTCKAVIETCKIFMGNHQHQIIITVLICLFILYSEGMNLWAYNKMRDDKKRSETQRWRIPEKKLLLLAFLGGSLGTFVGMHTIHHKTNKKKFKWLVPLFLIVQILLCPCIIYCIVSL
jgi:uncharacterized membrane protein YsdA (DUF1294 family)